MGIHDNFYNLRLTKNCIKPILMRPILKILVLFFAIILSKPLSAQELQFKGIHGFKVKSVEKDKITLVFVTKIENTTGKTLKVKVKNGELLKNDQLIGTYKLEKPVKIKKRSDENLDITLVVTPLGNLNLLNDGVNMMLGKPTEIKVQGSLKGSWLVFSKKYPFSFEEKLSLRGLFGL